MSDTNIRREVLERLADVVGMDLLYQPSAGRIVGSGRRDLVEGFPFGSSLSVKIEVVDSLVDHSVGVGMILLRITRVLYVAVVADSRDKKLTAVVIDATKANFHKQGLESRKIKIFLAAVWSRRKFWTSIAEGVLAVYERGYTDTVWKAWPAPRAIIKNYLTTDVSKNALRNIVDRACGRAPQDQ